jgi:hypothetical protein
MLKYPREPILRPPLIYGNNSLSPSINRCGGERQYISMNKKALALSLAGLALVAAPVFAKDGGSSNGLDHGKGNKFGIIKNLFGSDASQFVVTGTVQSVGTNTFVVKVNASAHVDNISSGNATVKIDPQTKFSDSASLSADLVGKSVVVLGKVNGTDLLATSVKLISSKDSKDEKKSTEVKKNKVMGEVTAVTDTSITIKNSLTGDIKTLITEPDTKITIDGQIKDPASIKVGDSGWVKIKAVGTTLVAKFAHLFR